MTISSKSQTIITLGTITVAALIANAGIAHNWNAAVNGNWHDGFSWNVGTVPTSTSPTTLGFGTAYTVSVVGTQSSSTMFISNPNATLEIINAAIFNQFGTVTNNGLISVNPGAGGGATQFDFEQSGNLQGTGILRLNAPSTRARIRTGVGVNITHSAGHTIDGQGRIEALMDNLGLISANVPGTQLELSTNDKTNSGTMQAIDGARLDISSISVDQFGAGQIIADGPGSQIELTTTTINNGALATTNTATIEAFSSNTLNAVSISGILNTANASSTFIENGITNNSVLNHNASAGGGATTFEFTNSATLAGTGSLNLVADGSRSRVRGTAGAVITQAATHTIHGQGQIEAALVNDGLVSADVNAARMRLVTEPKTNNATMEAINGSTLEVTGITLDQSPGGQIAADGVGSQIELVNSTIQGGTLSTINGADIDQTGTVTLDGVTLAGEFDILNASVLHIANSFINNGTINLNPSAGGSATTIDIDHSMTIMGNGIIDLVVPGTRSRLRTVGAEVLTLGSGQTIEGQGQVEANLINDGLIRANDGAQMLLNINPKTNNTTIEALNASIIEINGVTITQDPNAQIRTVDAASQIELVNATLLDGNLTAALGSDIEVTGNVFLDSISFSGEMNILNAQVLHISNSIVNSGLIRLNSNVGGSATTLDFDNSGSFLGSGTLDLVTVGTRSRLRTAAGQTLTNSGGHTIEGQGQIEADLINDGLVSANDSGQQMLFNINPKLNNATIQAVNDSILEINGITVTQGGFGQLIANGTDSQIELVNATVVGGNLSTINDADVEVTGISHLDAVDSTAVINLLNSQSLGVSFGTLNNGTIIVNSNAGGSTTSLVWDEEMVIGGAGTIRLNATGSRSRLVPGSGVSQGGIGSEQRLEGIGQIAIDLINDGTIAPGLSIGTMSANQPIFFAGISSFEAEVNATTSDLLDSTSTIEVHGTLDVLFIDGFAPTGFWARTIIEGSDITGEFDTVNVPPAPVGLVTKVLNTGTEIIVGQTCPADANIDGVLDFFDVSKFLAQFAAMDPAADFNNDGDFDFFDVSLFLAQFGAGCP